MPTSFSAFIISRISCRSIGPPQAVVAGAVGLRLVAEPQRLGRGDGVGCRRLSPAGEDVEDHVAADGALGEGLCAGRLARIEDRKSVVWGKRVSVREDLGG